MLRDNAHIFRRMWATDGWAKMQPDALTGPHSPCWLHPRDDAAASQPASTYFEETLSGKYCPMNWYEGNPGILGLRGRPPTFSEDAPALFGADEDIGAYCQNKMKRDYGLTPSNAFGHAGNCVAANLNILNVFTDRVPYNICRNMEWQVCAMKGEVPSQGSNAVLLATEPNSLDPKPGSRRPLGRCSGWRPPDGSPDTPTGGFGYTNDDIYYIETCLFDQLCTNGADIFRNRQNDQPFHCEFSHERFLELEQILSEPAVEVEDSPECAQVNG